MWLSRAHFDLLAPSESVRFQVRATFDVVGAPGWRITLETQPCHELWLVREGEVEVTVGEQHAILKAPALGFLQAGTARDTRHIAGAPPSILGFSFDVTLWGALDLMQIFDLPLAPSASTEIFEPMLSRIVSESRAKAAGYALAVHALAGLTFVELLRACNVREEGRNLGRVAPLYELEAALQLVQSRFDEPLDVAQMAHAAHLSPKHFGRKFHAALGLTPMEYLRRVRLGRARDLLASSDQTAGVIAARVGFASSAHFSRAFKSEFGLSPQEFRVSLRVSDPLRALES